MNSLSWFLYWIDVISSLSGVFAAASCLLIVAIIALWVSSGMRLDDTRSDEKATVRQSRNSWTWRLAIMAGCFAVVSSFMPAKGTMYAIAASQVGEKIAQSEAVKGIANDATKALQIWIKKQIEPEAKK